MVMAATFAGMGFGNAGVHIPHANAYPIAGHGEGLPPRRLPAGRADGAARQSVSLTAPEAFRFSFEASPERHLRAAAAAGTRTRTANDPAEQLPDGARRADARHRHPQRHRRRRLRRGRRARPGGGHHEAAAAAGHLPRARPTEDDIAGILTRSVENLVTRTRAASHGRRLRGVGDGARPTSTTRRCARSRRTPSDAGDLPDVDYRGCRSVAARATPTRCSAAVAVCREHDVPLTPAAPAPRSPARRSAPRSSWTSPGTSNRVLDDRPGGAHRPRRSPAWCSTRCSAGRARTG